MSSITAPCLNHSSGSAGGFKFEIVENVPFESGAAHITPFASPKDGKIVLFLPPATSVIFPAPPEYSDYYHFDPDEGEIFISQDLLGLGGAGSIPLLLLFYEPS